MEHLSDFFTKTANLLEYPDDLDQESFVVYQIPVSNASLISALATFNEINPLEIWDWCFDLDIGKYRSLPMSEAVYYLKHFIGEHLRYENGVAIAEDALNEISSLTN